MSLQIGQQLGSYQITSLIGKGGMGEVYRAKDTKLKRDVAIKILPEEFSRDTDRVSRFQREAESLAALNHQNIAAIYDLQQSDATRFLILEYVEGETLADILKKRGALPVEEALHIAKQITEALEAAHDKGIIHRDLKPANVKITPDGKVKVLDFGLAKAFETETSNTNLSQSPTLSMAATNAGVILGTAAYMSPEQARGLAASYRSDVFSFGCVLYEMLTGRQAFQGETVSDILASVLAREPDLNLLPANLNPRIHELLRRSLEKNPRNRWQAVGDLRVEIETILANPRGMFMHEQPAVAPKRLWKRAIPLVAAAMVGVVVSAAVLRTNYVQPPNLDATSIRFTVQPNKVLSNPGTSEIALSPNGRYLVFGDDVGSGKALWLRALNSAQARLLPGTEGSGLPFWSPDSKYIGFWADGKLKRVSVDGGSAETICNAPTNSNGTWGPDGVIVFGAAGGGLLRVGASGGLPVAFTKLDQGHGEITHQFPQFLPDGRHILYFVNSTQAEQRGTYVRSLDSPDSKRVLAAEYRAIYASPGYLLVVRDDKLVAYPFDAERLQITGDAIGVADNVGTNPNGNLSSIGVSNDGILAFGGSGGALVQLTWYDRTGRRLENIGEPDRLNEVRLSPNEKRAALVKADLKTNTLDIWLLELSTKVLSRFTLDPASDGNPIWSPDGRYIAFHSNRKGLPNDIYQKEVGGSEESLLLQSPNPQYPHDWTKDGRFIIFYGDTRGADGVFLLPLSGEPKPVQVMPPTHFATDEFNLSTDGKWIAYNSQESGRWEVWVASFPKFTDRRQVSNNGGAVARWRKDEKELYYLALDGKMMAVDVNAGSTIETGTPKLLFQTRISVRGQTDQYDVTGDGRRFLLLESPESATVPPITVITNWTASFAKSQ